MISCKKPPMGWNSYDYYDTTVNEAQIRANADYMAEHLKEFGWEYVVVDIEWYSYEAGEQRDRFQYVPFSKVEMDAYSRLLPYISCAESRVWRRIRGRRSLERIVPQMKSPIPIPSAAGIRICMA